MISVKSNERKHCHILMRLKDDLSILKALMQVAFNQKPFSLQE